MKLRCIVGLILAVGVSVQAQTISQPSGLNIFTNQVLTNVYTSSTSVDLQSWNTISLLATVPTQQSAGLAKIKPQWSQDNTTWVDQSVLLTNGVSGTEAPYLLASKQITISLSTNINSYIEILPRVARYFRVSVASTNVLTTGTLQINVQNLNNYN